MRTKHRFLPWICLLGLGLLLGGSVQAADCKVSIKAEERGTEDRVDVVIHRFLIQPELKSDIECGKLEYDLVVVERAKDGSEQTKRVRSSIKLKRGEAKARKVEYRASKDVKVASWKFEAYRCTPCGM